MNVCTVRSRLKNDQRYLNVYLEYTRGGSTGGLKVSVLYKSTLQCVKLAPSADPKQTHCRPRADPEQAQSRHNVLKNTPRPYLYHTERTRDQSLGSALVLGCVITVFILMFETYFCRLGKSLLGFSFVYKPININSEYREPIKTQR